MKKDIQNVVITFSLIAVMLYGGSFLYAKKVIVEDMALRLEEYELAEELLSQERAEVQLLKINLEQERQLVEKKLQENVRQRDEEKEEEEEEKVVKTVQSAPKIATPVVVTPQPDPAILVAQKKAQADLLAEQIALAKKEAEKLAQQKQEADAKKSAAKASRKSRAS